MIGLNFLVGVVFTTLTFYNPEPKQTDGDCLTTADLSHINVRKLKAGKVKWIAVSRDLLKKYPYGTKVRVKCIGHDAFSGVYTVHDTMKSTWTNKIDVLIHKDDNKNHPDGKYKCIITNY